MKALAASLALGLCFLAGPTTAKTLLLVVSGVGGEETYSDAFFEWSLRVVDAGLAAGIDESDVVYLAEDPARDPVRIDGEARRETFESALEDLTATASAQDDLWVILFGHGSSRNGESRFNLVGRDMTDDDFASLFDSLPTGGLVFVNASSSSAGFVETLSSPGRAVVTATRTESERHATTFGEFFSLAFADLRADVDKDTNVSLLEAFNYARIEVDRQYRDSGRLPTEHALLDDNGDGEGTLEPNVGTDDGSLASRLFLARGVASDREIPPRMAALLAEKQELEDRIAELRGQRSSLDSELYQRELQTLLLSLAQTDESLRELETEEAGDAS